MAKSDWIGAGISLLAGGIAYLVGGPATAACMMLVGLIILVVVHFQGSEPVPMQTIFGTLSAIPISLIPATEVGPEIMLACEKVFYEKDESLIVQHIGGGSIRNVQVSQMTNGHWTANFPAVPYIAVGGKESLKARFTPVSPLAISEMETGHARMSLGFFFVTSVEPSIGPIKVLVRHEDATSKLEIETDFEVTYGRQYEDLFQIVERYVFTQKARRVTKVSLM